MSPFDQLPEAAQLNVLRIHIAGEEAAKAAGRSFEFTLDDTVELMENIARGGPWDTTFVMPPLIGPA